MPSANPEILQFRVNGVMPSLENYRKRAGERRAESNQQWVRILAFKELVGWMARQAARPGQLKRLYGRPVSVEVLLCGQRVDLDNCKALIDGMKEIVFPDDSQQYLRRLEAVVGAEDIYDQPCVVVRVTPWE